MKNKIIHVILIIDNILYLPFTHIARHKQQPTILYNKYSLFHPARCTDDINLYLRIVHQATSFKCISVISTDLLYSTIQNLITSTYLIVCVYNKILLYNVHLSPSTKKNCFFFETFLSNKIQDLITNCTYIYTRFQ